MNHLPFLPCWSISKAAAGTYKHNWIVLLFQSRHSFLFFFFRAKCKNSLEDRLIFCKSSQWDSKPPARFWRQDFIWFSDNANKLWVGEVQKSRNLFPVVWRLSTLILCIIFCYCTSWRVAALLGGSSVPVSGVLVPKLFRRMPVRRNAGAKCSYMESDDEIGPN